MQSLGITFVCKPMSDTEGLNTQYLPALILRPVESPSFVILIRDYKEHGRPELNDEVGLTVARRALSVQLLSVEFRVWVEFKRVRCLPGLNTGWGCTLAPRPIL